MNTKWVIPCNVKYYNIVEHFKKQDTLVCKRMCAAEINDEVFLYVALPYGCMKYRCVVLETNVKREVLEQHAYALQNGGGNDYPYMLIKLVSEYEDNQYPLSLLKKHGLNQVQKQARADKKLVAYINGETENEITV